MLTVVEEAKGADEPKYHEGKYGLLLLEQQPSHTVLGFSHSPTSLALGYAFGSITSWPNGPYWPKETFYRFYESYGMLLTNVAAEMGVGPVMRTWMKP